MKKPEVHETRMRIPVAIYKKLVKQAEKNYRSINAEIVEILKRVK